MSKFTNAPVVTAEMGGDQVLIVSCAIDSTNTDRLRRHAAQLLDARPDIVEVAFASNEEGAVRVVIVEQSTRERIAFCGGVTQVLGLVQSDRVAMQHLGLPYRVGALDLVLDCGPVEITSKEGLLWTDVTSVAKDYVHYTGNGQLGLPSVHRMGEFLILNAGDVQKRVQVNSFDEPSRLYAWLEEEVLQELGEPSCYAAIWRGSGDRLDVCFRFVPRLQNDNCACGTGALALALHFWCTEERPNGRRGYEFRVISRGVDLGTSRIQLHSVAGALSHVTLAHDRVRIGHFDTVGGVLSSLPERPGEPA